MVILITVTNAKFVSFAGALVNVIWFIQDLSHFWYAQAYSLFFVSLCFDEVNLVKTFDVVKGFAVMCLQCSDTVGWAAGRASGL